ncbi:creatininase family protein [Microlunatus soli]|uniref:Creatinine amidohydrolase n=1 Tax=Microlunatus soli TaxID=630515 RepID=A0A1H1V7C8_9ACTN|nr:creatininase family protein [Microlunatus soli]SDS80520.1 creatinine amidohydrolase [Microlunatus soli]
MGFPELATMTTVEATTAVAAAPLVVLPVGAQEQHGPGMAMCTDTVRAEGVASRVVEGLAGRAVLAPALPYGVSPHHVAFAGTMSLTAATFQTMINELIDSLYDAGWRKILIITGHGGNAPALSVVAQDQLQLHPELWLAWSPITALAKPEIAQLDVTSVHGHSGQAETAQMQFLAPELVRDAELQPGTTEVSQLTGRARLSRSTLGPKLAVGFDSYHQGVLGDPRQVTAEDGKLIIDAVVDKITRFAQEMIMGD